MKLQLFTRIHQLSLDLQRVWHDEPRLIHKPINCGKYILWHSFVKHVKREFIYILNNQKFFLDTKSDGCAYVFFQPLMEYPVTWLINKAVRKDQVFFDIGANIGYYSMLAANQESIVHAFEPNTNPARILRINQVLNSFNNLHIQEAAVSSKDGSATFHVFPLGHSGLSSFEYTSPDAEDKLVRCLSLDSYAAANSISSIRLIKIDVEGHELDVFRGATKILQSKKVDFIIWETNQENFDKSMKSINLLSKHGYTTYFFTPNTKKLHQWDKSKQYALSLHDKSHYYMLFK